MYLHKNKDENAIGGIKDRENERDWEREEERKKYDTQRERNIERGKIITLFLLQGSQPITIKGWNFSQLRNPYTR